MLSGNPSVLPLPCDDPTSEIFSAINIPMGIIPFQTQFALLLRPVGQGRERPRADAICSHSSEDLSSSKCTFTVSNLCWGGKKRVIYMKIKKLSKSNNEIIYPNIKIELLLLWRNCWNICTLVLWITQSRRFTLIGRRFNCNGTLIWLSR